MTAESLGKQTYTSKATVFRLCKKLGFTGFTELKQQLILETIEKQRVIKISKTRPVNQDTAVGQLPDSVIAMYDEALTMTKLGLKKEQLQKVINRLSNLQTIDIYGSGITEGCAQAAAFKFRTLGINSSAQTNINEHYYAATRTQRHQAAILISFTGGNTFILEACHYLRQLGVYVIGIGGVSDLSLKKASDIFLEAPADNLTISMEVVSQMTAVNFILDVLFAGLTVRKYPEVIKNSISLVERHQGINKKRKRD